MATKSIPIELDKHRALRFTGVILSEAEKTLGVGLLTLMNERPFYGLQMALHYGLKWDDRKMTPTLAAELMDVWMDNGGTFEQLTEMVADALKLSGYVGEKLKDEAVKDTEGNAPPEAP
jgi:hypothetical protein